ncbi:Reverse transcriptase (RNA-dependent DNA polymerase), partial [Rhizoctonia solani]
MNNKLNIIQLNVAGCQLRVHSLLNDKSYLAASILMIQDPWWGRIGYNKTIDPKTINIYGTTNSPFWMCFSPPGISGPKGPGVSIYVRRDIPGLLAQYSDSLPPHPNVLAVDIIYNGSLTTLVNVYIHSDNKRYEEALNHLICHPYPSSHPIVIAGDFNAHHPNWALEGSKWVDNHPNPNARLLDNWISENDFHIFNDLTMPTRIGRRGQSDSIINLTLLNSAAVDAFEDFEWTCKAEGAMGLDHNIILWTISLHIHADGTTDTKPPPNFVIDLEIEDDWTSCFDFLLSLALLPLNPKTPADLESMANSILQAMTQATQDTMPQKKQGKRGSQLPWWSSKCSKALRELKHPSDSRSCNARRAALRGAIRRACKSHANKVCKAATVGNIFRYTNWYKGKQRAPLPPIRFGGSLVTQPQQKAITLTNKFFPKATLAKVLLEPLGIPLSPQRPWHSITKEEVEAALADLSNTSAPGAFGTNYQLLKWAFSLNPVPILALYNGCLTLGYHPTCLCNAVIAVIPKPNRNNMSNPKSYRPISLLETLSKCLEKVIMRRLIYESGKFDLIPHSQFGGRNMTSCINASLCLTHNVKAQWALGKHVSLLTMDVSGYFNNVDHARLVYTLRRLGFAHKICQWLISYLHKRTAQPKIDDTLCNPINLPAVGIPQGSPLSPILSSIYLIPLLRAIQDPQVHTYAYVNNFSILAFSHSHSANAQILKEIALLANETLQLLGLEFKLPKSNLIHFISQKQQPSNAKVKIPLEHGALNITPKVVVRWLGFYLDQKLNFQEHIRYMANKANAVLAGLQMLADTVRGMTMRHARILFISCV